MRLSALEGDVDPLTGPLGRRSLSLLLWTLVAVMICANSRGTI